MRSFFYNLDKIIADSQISHNDKLKDFCCEVKNFVLKGNFTKYKNKELILDYWGQPDSYVEKMTGMKSGTVRTARTNLSRELYDMFGYDFFEVIYIGDEKALLEGRCRLDIAKMGFKSSNFLYRELISNIRLEGKVFDDIDIVSCKSEIQFLVRHSRQNIDRELSVLDKDKLLYLVRMLDNETGTPVNIRNLIKCFEKGV